MSKHPYSLTGLAVRGFKSICAEQEIEIRPLTILAGANSSGKSSIMQPLLLLKQTLEDRADRGALFLDGPNLKFTSTDQLLSKGANENREFSVRITCSNGDSLEIWFAAAPKLGFDVKRMSYRSNDQEFDIRRGMKREEIIRSLSCKGKAIVKEINGKGMPLRMEVKRDRCFLRIQMPDSGSAGQTFRFWQPSEMLSPGRLFEASILSFIHLPGLRGNPRRTYPKTAATTSPHFPGTFDDYVASLVFQWQSTKDEKWEQLGRCMEGLGLSWRVSAKPVDDTKYELRVGRLPLRMRGGSDMVSIADVGFGVSQCLPVLVALIEARAGQLVYLEQPEIHLHPKAQRGLARLLCESAQRGANLVVETHSALLLREVQTLVALEKMPKEDVILHWFQRDKQGATTVSSAELDENGAYGDWPEDFDETELDADIQYLEAVERRGVSR